MSQAVKLVPSGRKFGVIGAGVMGQALMKGMLSAGLLTRDQIWAADRSDETRAQVARDLGVHVCDDYRDQLPTTDVLLVCVKPAQIVPAMAAARASGPEPETLFISILAGKLPQHQQKRARRVGLALAMITRLLLLLSLAWIIKLTAPLFTVVGQEIPADFFGAVAKVLAFVMSLKSRGSAAGLHRNPNSASTAA